MKSAYTYGIYGRIIMTKLVTFTPREAEAITHYLTKVTPVAKTEQDELYTLIQRLQRLLIKLDDI